MYIYSLEMGTTGKDGTSRAVKPEKQAFSVCLVRLILHFSMLSVTTWQNNENMEELSGYVSPCKRPCWAKIWRVMCTTEGTDTMARSYWSLSLIPAEQGCNRRLAIVIYPDDSWPKTGGKCLLIAITVQPEDALVFTNKIRYLAIQWLTVTC